MKIIETYIIKDMKGYENVLYYKLHECIGINNFSREYYREDNGELSKLKPEFAKELIENYGK